MVFRRRIETNRFQENISYQNYFTYCWFRYATRDERSGLLNQRANLSFRFSNPDAGGRDPDGSQAIVCRARLKYPH